MAAVGGSGSRIRRGRSRYRHGLRLKGRWEESVISVICVSPVPTGWVSRSHGDNPWGRATHRSQIHGDTTRGDERHTDHRSNESDSRFQVGFGEMRDEVSAVSGVEWL